MSALPTSLWSTHALLIGTVRILRHGAVSCLPYLLRTVTNEPLKSSATPCSGPISTGREEQPSTESLDCPRFTHSELELAPFFRPFGLAMRSGFYVGCALLPSDLPREPRQQHRQN